MAFQLHWLYWAPGTGPFGVLFHVTFRELPVLQLKVFQAIESCRRSRCGRSLVKIYTQPWASISEQGDVSPPCLVGWGTQYQMSPSCFSPLNFVFSRNEQKNDGEGEILHDLSENHA